MKKHSVHTIFHLVLLAALLTLSACTGRMAKVDESWIKEASATQPTTQKIQIRHFYYPTVDNWPPAANQWGKRRKLNSLADITTARDSLRARGDQGMTGSARTVTLAPSTRPAQPDLFRPDDSA